MCEIGFSRVDNWRTNKGNISTAATQLADMLRCIRLILLIFKIGVLLY